VPADEAEAGRGGEAPADETCYRCRTRLEEGARHCPRCGRPQTRVCFCGNHIPITARACSHCGADWSQAARVRRRSHHARLDRATLGKYALAGGALALVVAALANMFIQHLAAKALASGQALPRGFADKLHLARLGWPIVWQQLAPRLGSLASALGLALGALALGALIGVVVYLSKRHVISWPWLRHRHRRRAGSRPPTSPAP
jgi:hypothetical protein